MASVATRDAPAPPVSEGKGNGQEPSGKALPADSIVANHTEESITTQSVQAPEPAAATAPGQSDGERKLRARLERTADSLGWLTESTIQPKKQRVIEGVSTASIVGLKAQVYKAQEEAKLRAEGKVDTDKHVRKARGINVAEILFARKNKGVDAREERDAHEEAAEKDSYQALERKAALYDKLARGHAEDDEETYNVDFFRKGSSLAEEEATLDGERQQYHYAGATTYQERNADDEDDWRDRGRGGLESEDMERERRRAEWERESTENMQRERATEQRRAEQRRIIDQLSKETRQGRDRARALKNRRQLQMQDKRQRLREQYLAKLAQGKNKQQGQQRQEP